jgi:adenylate kinase
VIVILFGPPGSGKGTQSQALAEKHGFFKLSTGDLIRKEIAEKTPLGLEVQSIVEAGEFPDSALVNQIAEKAIVDNITKSGIVLDGYPRTMEQVNFLDKILSGLGKKIDVAICLGVDENELVRRIEGRRVCADCKTNYHVEFNPPANDGICDVCQGSNLVQRKDDTRDVLEQRLAIYNKETKPLLDYYDQKGVLTTISGMESPQEVAAMVEKILANVELDAKSTGINA